MSISLRGSKFHYRFRVAGIEHSGPCPGCEVPKGASSKIVASIEKKAIQAETDARTKVAQDLADREKAEAEVRRNKSVRALVENYKYELTGGAPIRIAD